MAYGAQRHFQQYFSYIVAVSFIGVGKAEYTEKTTDLPQVTDKRYQKPRTSHKSLTNFYHIML